MVGDARKLGKDHADLGATWRDLDAQKFFDGQGVTDVIVQRRDVVHPVRDRHELVVGSAFAQLLEARMQETDLLLAADHGLALDLQLEAQRSVGRRMRRTDIEQQGVLALFEHI